MTASQVAFVIIANVHKDHISSNAGASELDLSYAFQARMEGITRTWGQQFKHIYFAVETQISGGVAPPAHKAGQLPWIGHGLDLLFTERLACNASDPKSLESCPQNTPKLIPTTCNNLRFEDHSNACKWDQGVAWLASSPEWKEIKWLALMDSDFYIHDDWLLCYLSCLDSNRKLVLSCHQPQPDAFGPYFNQCNRNGTRGWSSVGFMNLALFSRASAHALVKAIQHGAIEAQTKHGLHGQADVGIAALAWMHRLENININTCANTPSRSHYTQPLHSIAGVPMVVHGVKGPAGQAMNQLELFTWYSLHRNELLTMPLQPPRPAEPLRGYDRTDHYKAGLDKTGHWHWHRPFSREDCPVPKE